MSYFNYKHVLEHAMVVDNVPRCGLSFGIDGLKNCGLGILGTLSMLRSIWVVLAKRHDEFCKNLI